MEEEEGGCRGQWEGMSRRWVRELRDKTREGYLMYYEACAVGMYRWTGKEGINMERVCVGGLGG